MVIKISSFHKSFSFSFTYNSYEIWLRKLKPPNEFLFSSLFIYFLPVAGLLSEADAWFDEFDSCSNFDSENIGLFSEAVSCPNSWSKYLKKNWD